MSDEMDLAEFENALLATGGVFAALHAPPGIVDAELVTDAVGNATNRIRVRFPFMKSAYLLTVTREPDSEGGAS